MSEESKLHFQRYMASALTNRVPRPKAFHDDKKNPPRLNSSADAHGKASEIVTTGWIWPRYRVPGESFGPAWS